MIREVHYEALYAEDSVGKHVALYPLRREFLLKPFIEKLLKGEIIGNLCKLL